MDTGITPYILPCVFLTEGLSGKETKYLCEYGISCFCLWPTGITGIPVATVKKMSRKILFLYIFIWKVKVINSKNYKYSGFFPARYPVPAQPEPEFEIREQDIPFRHKYLVPVPLLTVDRKITHNKMAF